MKLARGKHQDLAAKPELYDLIESEIRGINPSLQPGTEVTRFALLFKELDADDGELTRTRKIRRKVINERYGELIRALYDGTDNTDLCIAITYQDGSHREMTGAICIRDIRQQ